jgi:hypothetical protein
MTLAIRAKLKEPITRSYDFEPNRKAYDCEPSRKAYGRAISIGTEADFFLEIDEDTFIVGEAKESECAHNQDRMKRGKPIRGRLRKRYPHVAALFGLYGFSRKLKSKPAGKKAAITRNPRSPAVLQSYKGYVDAVHEGLAYLILENQNGQRLEIEWDAADLRRKSIGERQPFVLKTLATGNELKYEFIPDRIRPLPKALQQNIAELLSHYRATGDLDDHDE